MLPSYTVRKRIQLLKSIWKIERSESIIRRYIDIEPAKRIRQARREIEALKYTLKQRHGLTY